MVLLAKIAALTLERASPTFKRQCFAPMRIVDHFSVALGSLHDCLARLGWKGRDLYTGAVLLELQGSLSRPKHGSRQFFRLNMTRVSGSIDQALPYRTGSRLLSNNSRLGDPLSDPKP